MTAQMRQIIIDSHRHHAANDAIHHGIMDEFGSALDGHPSACYTSLGVDPKTNCGGWGIPRVCRKSKAARLASNA